MPTFVAEVEFRFECERQEAAGTALRRLSEAAERVGFELKRGTVVPAPPDEDDGSGWTSYAPLEDPSR
jgi:hypothetical protein